MKLKSKMVEGARGRLAFYYHNCGKSARGTLLCLHGGPGGDHHGNNNVFDEIYSYAIPMGYSFITFDMYGSGDSDGSQTDFDLSSMREDYRTAISFCRDNFCGDLHIVGESMGATVAAMDWYDKAKSNILLWPAFDLIDTDLKPYLSGFWLEMAKKNGYVRDGGLEMGASFLKELGEYDYSQCFNMPEISTLLVHGRKDMAVPFNQSIRATLESKGQVTLCVHPHGDHGLQSKEEREYTHGAIRKWLMEY